MVQRLIRNGLVDLHLETARPVLDLTSIHFILLYLSSPSSIRLFSRCTSAIRS